MEKLISPTRGDPYVCNSDIGVILECSSMAAMVAKAPPRLAPVITISFPGYLDISFLVADST